ncbi:hypothetical protein DAPPUDRAFT_257591 [Daphnia pulex]|uniref:Uncharacterized protein n=1 Tax=Daphnia pulex TaxID=6669 RepID=E9HDV6_DAPPU|nr:hypothetical protein DAPPUDRAFT_257591 [Daphnia pulex]|eukprot:EFX70094.1 hypothetical protein DAPPUDRAFT_257591 [Daphnia pulex]
MTHQSSSADVNKCMTERANEVDDHLDYLLGRLSLVVHDFNQMRGGLGEALESLRVQNLQKQADSQVRRPPNPRQPI